MAGEPFERVWRRERERPRHPGRGRGQQRTERHQVRRGFALRLAAQARAATVPPAEATRRASAHRGRRVGGVLEGVEGGHDVEAAVAVRQCLHQCEGDGAESSHGGRRSQSDTVGQVQEMNLSACRSRATLGPCVPTASTARSRGEPRSSRPAGRRSLCATCCSAAAPSASCTPARRAYRGRCSRSGSVSSRPWHRRAPPQPARPRLAVRANRGVRGPASGVRRARRLGSDWVEIAPEHLDPYAALWGMCRGIRYLPLPEERVTIRFELRDRPRNQRRYWLLVHRPEPEVCVKPPGFEEDLVVTTEAAWLARWVLGKPPRARHEGPPGRGRRPPAPGAHVGQMGHAGRTGPRRPGVARPPRAPEAYVDAPRAAGPRGACGRGCHQVASNVPGRCTGGISRTVGSENA